MRPDGPRPEVVGPEEGPEPPFPLRLDGTVIKGFGRGSKELGIPTANIPIEGLTIGGQPSLASGIYYGWAGLSSPSPSSTTKSHHTHHALSKLADGIASVIAGSAMQPFHDETHAAVYPFVASIGYNPYYKNEKRSVEVHIMHDFEHDFYGSHLNLCLLGFIREEYDYVDVESLVDDIRFDIKVAGNSLARKGYAKYAHEKELLRFEGRTEVAN
ncbi:hypothetical protein MBLNU457_4420t1 [Dothideomycetes sp. NU457]